LERTHLLAGCLSHKFEGVAILCVVHTNKSHGQYTDVCDSILGSTGLTASVDTILVLARERGGAEAMLHIVSREFDEDAEFALKRDPVTSWVLLGDGAEYRLTAARRSVVDAVRKLTTDGGKAFPKDIIREAAKPRDTIYQLLKKMTDAGQVISNPDGSYSLKERSDRSDGSCQSDRSDGSDGGSDRLSQRDQMADQMVLLSETSTTTQDTWPSDRNSDGSDRSDRFVEEDSWIEVGP
jgi:hypothetical protein